MPKHRTSTSSKRLQRVLRVLRDAGDKGLGIVQIMMRANVTDPKDCIYEIRWNWRRDGTDSEIVSEWHQTMNGIQYKKYVLVEG